MCASDLEGMAPPEMLEEMALKAEPAMSVGENGHDLREMTKEEKARRKQKFRFPRMVSEFQVKCTSTNLSISTAFQDHWEVDVCSRCFDMGYRCGGRLKSDRGHACKRCRVARTRCSLVPQSTRRTSKEIKDRKPLRRSGRLGQRL